MNGDADRAPVRCSIGQAYPQAGSQAAAGALIAHYYRQSTGIGQHVDVSIHECVVRTLPVELAMWEYSGVIVRRQGSEIRRINIHKDDFYMREVWRCKDGAVCFRVTGGTYGKGTQPLVAWMEEKGSAGTLADVDFSKLDMRSLEPETWKAWEQTFSEFFLKYTAQELYQEAVKRRFYLFPVADAEQAFNDQQLAARRYWVDVEHPELGDSITYPGGPYKFDLPVWGIRRRPPLVGEHNMEIYHDELGYSAGELSQLKEAGII